jgi:quercetin dioxygenase-like cupin family protein
MGDYTVVPAGEGKSYQWENDHIFIKVPGHDTGGAFAVVEDNMKAEFALGLHEHRTHSETFYILDGALKFYVKESWTTARKGATVFIPQGVPHAVKTAGAPAKALMIFQPAFFDDYLAAVAKLTPDQRADTQLQARIAEQYDIHAIGGMPEE